MLNSYDYKVIFSVFRTMIKLVSTSQYIDIEILLSRFRTLPTQSPLARNIKTKNPIARNFFLLYVLFILSCTLFFVVVIQVGKCVP